MLDDITVGDLMKHSLKLFPELGFTNNLYFLSNTLERHFVRSNLRKVIPATKSDIQLKRNVHGF